MKPKLTPWFWAGVLLLAAGFVLAHIILFFFARAKVAPLMGAGISATDFAAPYFYVMNRGVIVGLLLALCLLGYGQIRARRATTATQLSSNQPGVMPVILLLMPLLVALVSTVTLAFYVQQIDGAFTRYDHFLQR